MAIKVECLAVGELAANCYVVENEETGECVVVDPGAQAQRIVERVGGRKVAAVLLTHGHCDHIGAADEVCAHFDAPLYIHEADAPKLTDPDANVSRLFGFLLRVHTKPRTLAGGDTLHLAGMDIGVMHTPGHSMGSVCFLLPKGAGVLTGDTLFAHGYDRTDFADGDFGLLRASLRALLRMTPRQIAYPGHGEPGIAGRAEA